MSAVPWLLESSVSSASSESSESKNESKSESTGENKLPVRVSVWQREKGSIYPQFPVRAKHVQQPRAHCNWPTQFCGLLQDIEYSWLKYYAGSLAWCRFLSKHALHVLHPQVDRLLSR